MAGQKVNRLPALTQSCAGQDSPQNTLHLASCSTIVHSSENNPFSDHCCQGKQGNKVLFFDKVVAIYSACFDWIVLFWNIHSAIDKVQFLVGVLQGMKL